MTSSDPASAANHLPPIAAPNGIQVAPRAASHGGRHTILREFESLFETLNSRPIAERERLLLIGITSPTRGVGVSTIAINLARAAASTTDGRVALIDTNTGRAAVHECLSTPDKPGLNDYLAGTHEFAECFHETSWERLFVVPIGSPEERAQRVSVVELIESLEDSFDYVVVDLPPAGELGNRVALARNLDSVLLVLLRDRAEILNARAAIKQLAKQGIQVRGTVLNAIRKPAHSQTPSSVDIH